MELISGVVSILAGLMWLILGLILLRIVTKR
jgi:hypothetical protein